MIVDNNDVDFRQAKGVENLVPWSFEGLEEVLRGNRTLLRSEGHPMFASCLYISFVLICTVQFI